VRSLSGTWAARRRAYADRGYDDTLIRLEPGRLRAWDFADDL
jgi:hypothetical protein